MTHALQEIKDIVSNAKRYEKVYNVSRKLVEDMFSNPDHRARYLNGLAKRAVDELVASMINDQIVDITFTDDEKEYHAGMSILLLNKHQIEQLELAIDGLIEQEKNHGE